MQEPERWNTAGYICIYIYIKEILEQRHAIKAAKMKGAKVARAGKDPGEVPSGE